MLKEPADADSFNIVIKTLSVQVYIAIRNESVKIITVHKTDVVIIKKMKVSERRKI